MSEVAQDRAQPSSKQRAYALLADMRRKYLRAQQAESGTRRQEWLAGDPITVGILSRWIPELESIAEGLPVETTPKHPFGNGTRVSLARGIGALRDEGNAGDAEQLQELLSWLGPDTRESQSKASETPEQLSVRIGAAALTDAHCPYEEEHDKPFAGGPT